MTNIHMLLREGLSKRKLVFQDEVALQRIIGEILHEHQLLFVRELALSGSDRIDFYVSEQRTGIEIKVKGGLNPILRQLKRYAEHPSIKELILVCPRPWGVPATLSEKPLHMVSFFSSLV